MPDGLGGFPVVAANRGRIDDSFPSRGPANGKIGQFGFEFFTYARVAFLKVVVDEV